VYLASADWMTRNLSSRVEIAFPVWDRQAQELLLAQMKYQLNDGRKGRIVDEKGNNNFITADNELSSQQYMFELVSKLSE